MKDPAALRALSDEELATRLAEPDAERAIVSEAYRRFYPIMLRAAVLALGGERALAEDVVQDCFARLWFGRWFGRLRTPASLRSYLIASVRNAAVDRIRARRHLEPLPPDLEAVAAEDSLAGMTVEHPRFQAALLLLSDGDREIVRLRLQEGLGLGEIARRLNISYSAAAQRLSRAIAHARELV